MKKTTIISFTAGAGLVLGSLSVAASGFGGGWKQDSNTGTLYYDAGKPAQHHMNVPHGKSQKPTAANSFGNGWMHDRNTGTLYYDSGTPDRQQVKAGVNKKHSPTAANSFGNGWMHDRNTGTLYRNI